MLNSKSHSGQWLRIIQEVIVMRALLKKIMPRKVKVIIKKCFGYKDNYSIEKEYRFQFIDKRFEGKIVLVSGGGGAIGRGVCIRFAIEGAIVFVSGRNKEKLQTVIDEITSLGGRAFSAVMDVENPVSIETTFQNIISSYGKIDIVVNCAGGSPRQRMSFFYEQSVDVIDEILDVNLRGSLLCSHYAAQAMIKQQAGRIINIASTLGTNGQIKQTEYTAAKAGVIGYTKSLAMELGRYGITVNCVSPGLVQRGTFNSDQLKYLLNSNWMNQLGTPEQIANAVAFLASDEAAFITGQNLIVDGGWSLGVKGD